MSNKPEETRLEILEFKVLRISSGMASQMVPSSDSKEFIPGREMIVTEFLPQLFIQDGVSLPN